MESIMEILTLMAAQSVLEKYGMTAKEYEDAVTRC